MLVSDMDEKRTGIEKIDGPLYYIPLAHQTRWSMSSLKQLAATPFLAMVNINVFTNSVILIAVGSKIIG